MDQTLGKRIVFHRKRLGLTQDQLAEQLGVTAQAVSKWENDQSCPDISILPKLADIFGITTDALLGSASGNQVHEAEIVDMEAENQSGNSFEFTWNAGRKGSLCFALLVLAVGIQLFLGKVMSCDITFWNALWPSALLIFGIYGLSSKFSFVSMGCILFGGYFILDRWQLLPFSLGGELVFPIILVVFGLSLLVDAFKRPRKPHFNLTHNGTHSSKHKDEYHVQGESFDMNACFGEATKFVSLPLLHRGDISTSFGDYDIDFSGVEAVSDSCTIEANCSFGDLTLLIPRRFDVKLTTSTTFGDVDIDGHPEQETTGTIHIEANVSFGEISIRYI